MDKCFHAWKVTILSSISKVIFSDSQDYYSTHREAKLKAAWYECWRWPKAQALINPYPLFTRVSAIMKLVDKIDNGSTVIKMTAITNLNELVKSGAVTIGEAYGEDRLFKICWQSGVTWDVISKPSLSFFDGVHVTIVTKLTNNKAPQPCIKGS